MRQSQQTHSSLTLRDLVYFALEQQKLQGAFPKHSEIQLACEFKQAIDNRELIWYEENNEIKGVATFTLNEPSRTANIKWAVLSRECACKGVLGKLVEKGCQIAQIPLDGSWRMIFSRLKYQNREREYPLTIKTLRRFYYGK